MTRRKERSQITFRHNKGTYMRKYHTSEVLSSQVAHMGATQETYTCTKNVIQKTPNTVSPSFPAKGSCTHRPSIQPWHCFPRCSYAAGRRTLPLPVAVQTAFPQRSPQGAASGRATHWVAPHYSVCCRGHTNTW